MSLATSTHQPTTELNDRTERFEKEVEVISTSCGGADIARAIHRSGCLVGYRSADNRPPEGIPVGFIDWPFDCERSNYGS